MKNKKNIILALIFFLLFSVIIIFIFNNRDIDPYSDKITLKKAAKIGQIETNKLLVQIEENKGNGRYERGDVVLTASSTKEFSLAEKSGFLIIKMDLTPTQADMITRSLESKVGEDENGPVYETLKRRKYAVDLEKVGISSDDFKGRELDDIYKWDILVEKK